MGAAETQLATGLLSAAAMIGGGVAGAAIDPKNAALYQGYGQQAATFIQAAGSTVANYQVAKQAESEGTPVSTSQGSGLPVQVNPGLAQADNAKLSGAGISRYLLIGGGILAAVLVAVFAFKIGKK